MKKIYITADSQLNITDYEQPKISLGDTVVIELTSSVNNTYSIRYDFVLPNESASYLRQAMLIDTNLWSYELPNTVLSAVSSKNKAVTLEGYITAYNVINNTINEAEGFINKLGNYTIPSELPVSATVGVDYAVVAFEEDGITANENIWQYTATGWEDSGLKEKLTSVASTTINIAVDKFIQNSQELVDATVTDLILENLATNNATVLDHETRITTLEGEMDEVQSDVIDLEANKVDKDLSTYPSATLTSTQELYINDGGTAKKTTLLGLSNYLEPKIVQQLSSGATEKPTLTDNLDGSVTVNACCVNLYDNDDFNGLIKNYNILPLTVSLVDQSVNYIVADYNNGNPILRNTIIRDEINQSNIVPIFTIVRTGTILHTLDWDEMGKGAIEKNIEKAVAVRRFEREFGLIPSVYGTRNIALSSGAMWYGLTRVPLDAIASDIDNILFYYHSAGVWNFSLEPTFRNTQYDNGTDLVTLTAGRYAVIWLWRGVEYQKHLYAVLGSGDYTLNQAIASDVPNPPSTVSAHAVLVGRIIVQKGSDTPYSVESSFDTTFNLSGASVHNDLTGRDADDAHPISSITGLQTALDGKLNNTTATTTIAVADWSGGTTATKTVSGVTSTNTIFVAPNPTDYLLWANAQIRATVQGTDQITFTCTTTPTEDVDVNIVIG